MADNLLREADGGLVRRADIGRRKRDPPHLRRSGIGQLASSVSDIDVPQTREPVDVFAAIGTAQHGPMPFDDNQRLTVVVGMMQRVNQVAPVGFEQLGDAVHVASSPPVRTRRNALTLFRLTISTVFVAA